MTVWEVSRPARRRVLIRQDLPTERPAVLDQIAALLNQLPAAQDLGFDELVGTMSAASVLRNRLDAVVTACAGEADVRGVAQILRAGTAGTLVAIATGSNPAVGSGIVGTARALRELPLVSAAFAAGRLTVWHVHAFKEAAPRIDGFADLEEGLVAAACEVEPAEIRRLLEVLASQCTPEGPDHDLSAQREKRRLSLSETPGGMFRLDGWLDALEGRRLRDALLSFSDRGGAHDRRDAKQRRADALADIISVANANTRPLGVSGLTVLVDVEQLPDGLGAVLEDGKVLGPATFELLSCTAALACVFGVRLGGGFVPLAMGRASRRATMHQWVALVARDRGCVRCGKAPRACEAHHIVHWAHGGLTDLSNLVLLCSRCHHDLHMGFYVMTMGEDGLPVITSTRAPPGLAG